jgi:hypothetical protein
MNTKLVPRLLALVAFAPDTILQSRLWLLLRVIIIMVRLVTRLERGVVWLLETRRQVRSEMTLHG